jgi:hypothetical protein
LFAGQDAKVSDLQVSSVAKDRKVADLQVSSDAKDPEVADLQVSSVAEDPEVVDLQVSSVAKDPEVEEVQVSSVAKDPEVEEVQASSVVVQVSIAGQDVDLQTAHAASRAYNHNALVDVRVHGLPVSPFAWASPFTEQLRMSYQLSCKPISSVTAALVLLECHPTPDCEQLDSERAPGSRRRRTFRASLAAWTPRPTCPGLPWATTLSRRTTLSPSTSRTRCLWGSG